MAAAAAAALVLPGCFGGGRSPPLGSRLMIVAVTILYYRRGRRVRACVRRVYACPPHSACAISVFRARPPPARPCSAVFVVGRSKIIISLVFDYSSRRARCFTELNKIILKKIHFFFLFLSVTNRPALGRGSSAAFRHFPPRRQRKYSRSRTDESINNFPIGGGLCEGFFFFF